jgi:hypothetical protein
VAPSAIVGGAEELAGAAVAGDQDQAPDEIGGQAPGQDHAEHRQALAERIGAGGQRQVADRLPGIQAPGEAAGHDAREDRDENAFLQVEFGHPFAGRTAQVALLGAAGAGDDDDAGQGDGNAQQRELAAGGGGDRADRAVEDRRPHRADHGGEPSATAMPSERPR